MTKKEKLFERIKNNPNGVRFSELKQLLINENFVLDRVSGSHHIFRNKDVVFVIPMHKNYVKSVYVRKVIEIIDELRSQK